MEFELADRLRLLLPNADEQTAHSFASQLDPYVPLAEASGCEPDVVIAAAQPATHDFDDVQHAAGDRLVTATKGREFYLVHDGRGCLMPTGPAAIPLNFVYDRGFNIAGIFRPVIRPALQIALLGRGAVAVHGAAVDTGDGGLVIAGWSETGKTETALAFLERGARFLSDKWTIVGGDGTVSAFPITVGIRRWVLEYLPRLRAALPWRARAQFVAAASLSALSGLTKNMSARHGVAAAGVAALQRGAELGDRAALRPSEVRRVYGHEATRGWSSSLRALALLTTVPGSEISARPADATWAAQRLAHSAAYERRQFFQLYERLRYASPEVKVVTADEVARREQALLEGVLSRVIVVDVRTPFPVDPRRVADVVERML